MTILEAIENIYRYQRMVRWQTSEITKIEIENGYIDAIHKLEECGCVCVSNAIFTEVLSESLEKEETDELS